MCITTFSGAAPDPHPLKAHLPSLFPALLRTVEHATGDRAASAARALSLLGPNITDGAQALEMAATIARSAASRAADAKGATCNAGPAPAAPAGAAEGPGGPSADDQPHVALASACMRIVTTRTEAAAAFEDLVAVADPGALPPLAGLGVLSAVAAARFDPASARCVRVLVAAVTAAWEAGGVAAGIDAVRCLADTIPPLEGPETFEVRF
jgi:hypothetical protein